MDMYQDRGSGTTCVFFAFERWGQEKQRGASRALKMSLMIEFSKDTFFFFSSYIYVFVLSLSVMIFWECWSFYVFIAEGKVVNIGAFRLSCVSFSFLLLSLYGLMFYGYLDICSARCFLTILRSSAVDRMTKSVRRTYIQPKQLMLIMINAW